jgi:hypothetical protein
MRFAHVRSEHMRWQAYGPREAPHRKLILIRPTVVRPDLPMPASNHWYVIKDDVLPPAAQ